MIVTVTQEDIDLAIERFESSLTCGICQNCPVAVALQRYFPEFGGEPWTDGGNVGLYDMTGMRAFPLPEHVQEWVGQFDHAYHDSQVLRGQFPDALVNGEPTPFPAVPMEFEVDDVWIRWQKDLLTNYPKPVLND